MRESTAAQIKEKKRKKREIIIIVSIVVVLVVVMSIYTLVLKAEATEASEELARYNEQIAEEEERDEELDKEEILMKSRDFIEKIARERLGLVDPDETIIKPKE